MTNHAKQAAEKIIDGVHDSLIKFGAEEAEQIITEAYAPIMDAARELADDITKFHQPVSERYPSWPPAHQLAEDSLEIEGRIIAGAEKLRTLLEGKEKPTHPIIKELEDMTCRAESAEAELLKHVNDGK